MNTKQKNALKLIFTTLLLVLLYRRMDWMRFASILRGIRPVPLLGFYFICILNMWMSSLRWRMLLQADDLHISTSKLFTSHWIASFFNFCMPSNIGGDVYRVADIAQKSGKAVNALASVFADRLTGFVAMALMGFVFPLIGLNQVPPEKRLILLVPLAIFLCFILVVLLVWQQKILRWSVRFMPLKIRAKTMEILETFLASARSYGKQPAIPVKCLLISLAFQFNVIIAVFCVGTSLGLQIPFFLYCVFVPLVGLLEAVPFSINGMGFRDLGYVMFFTAANLKEPTETAGVMAMLYMALTFIYASFGGIICLGRVARSGKPGSG